jgi:hypothetical protein
MSQKPKEPRELTTDEAMKRLFHPKVVAHAKRHAREAEKPSPKPSKKSMSKE